MTQLSQQRVKEHIDKDAVAQLILLIGSRAYVEFARPDSDIDLIVAHDKLVPEDRYVTLLEHSSICDLPPVMIEMRLFSQEQLEEYALRCELAKQFAFIRGFEVLLNRSPAALEAVKLCVDRYWTDNFKTYRELRRMDIRVKLQSLCYHFTDCRSYLRDRRLRGRTTLAHLRLAEVVKDFISQVWAVLCAQEAQQTEIPHLDVSNELLGSIGLLRVFNEPRGARIIDAEKYKVPVAVRSIIEELDRGIVSGHEYIFDCMERLFLQIFGEPLFVDDHHAVPAVVWR